MRRFCILDWMFFGIEGLLYLSYMFLDLFYTSLYEESILIKFLSIFFCFIYSLMWCRRDKTKSNIILTISVTFIFISDLFILILEYNFVGVCTFLIAQLLLLGYLFILEQDFTWKSYGMKFLRNILTSNIVLWIFSRLWIPIDTLFIISVIYIITFFYNLVEAVRFACGNRKRKAKLFAFGMLLYFLCDLNVGIFNTMSYVETSSLWFQMTYEFATIAMWMFYLPGILLIVRSGRYEV